MSRPEKTEISNDGLRYKSKKGGSPFEGLGRTGDTMSCIKCGVHKPRNNGSFKRILGSSMFVCFDCSPPRKKLIQQHLRQRPKKKPKLNFRHPHKKAAY